MIKKHVNIPVFVPHLGCPNDCIFCNQKKITGCERYDITKARDSIEQQLTTIDKSTSYVQIAFFGGSFTGIDREVMISMLSLANEYIKAGKVDSVRLSTRPDYISDDILKTLKEYNVNTVELGIQSMDDEVLSASRRGHTSMSSLKAAKLINDYGIEFVGQMMVGLPKSDLAKELFTANEICKMGAKSVRIYPTLVFADTALEKMYLNGEYFPLGIDETVNRCAELISVFHKNGIPVIRLGLCETDNLRTEGSVVAGPYHPAIGEMCENKVYLNVLINALDKLIECPQNLVVYVAKGKVSKAIGQRKINSEFLKARYNLSTIKFKEDLCLSGYDIRIEC